MAVWLYESDGLRIKDQTTTNIDGLATFNINSYGAEFIGYEYTQEKELSFPSSEGTFVNATEIHLLAANNKSTIQIETGVLASPKNLNNTCKNIRKLTATSPTQATMDGIAWLPRDDINLVAQGIREGQLEISYCADRIKTESPTIDFEFYNGVKTAKANISSLKDETIVLDFEHLPTYKSVKFQLPSEPTSKSVIAFFAGHSGNIFQTNTKENHIIASEPDKQIYTYKIWAPEWANLSEVGILDSSVLAYFYIKSLKDHDWSTTPFIAVPAQKFTSKFLSETKEFIWGSSDNNIEHGNITFTFTINAVKNINLASYNYESHKLTWHISKPAGSQTMPDLPNQYGFNPESSSYYFANHSDIPIGELGTIDFNYPHEFSSFTLGWIQIVPMQQELHTTIPTELTPYPLPPENLGFQYAHRNRGKFAPTPNIHTWLYNAQGEIIKEGYSDANGIIDFGIVTDADSFGYAAGSYFPTTTVNIIKLPSNSGLYQSSAFPLNQRYCNRIKINDFAQKLPFKPIDFEYTLEDYKLYRNLNTPDFNLGLMICENEFNSYNEAHGVLGLKNESGDWAFIDIFARDGSFRFPGNNTFKPGLKLPPATNPGGDLSGFTTSHYPVLEQTFGLKTLNDTNGYYPDSTQTPLIAILQRFTNDTIYCSRNIDMLADNPFLELATPITLPLEKGVTFEKNSLSFTSKNTPGADQTWKLKTNYVVNDDIFIGVTIPFEGANTQNIVKIPTLPQKYKEILDANLAHILAGVSVGGSPHYLNFRDYLKDSIGLKIGAGTTKQRKTVPVNYGCHISASIF